MDAKRARLASVRHSPPGSRRALQDRLCRPQLPRAKGFDTFCPVGPHIETDLDPASLQVETRVNGALRQSGKTSLMIYPVPVLIRWISRMMTLLPGDLIATGTPAGVGPLVSGDT